MKTYWSNSKSARLSSKAVQDSACFTPNASSSHWGTIGRLGVLILLLESQCHGTFNMEIEWGKHEHLRV